MIILCRFNLPLDIFSPALRFLCCSLDLVTSWISSVTTLHHRAKRVFSQGYDWRLVHIASFQSQPSPPDQRLTPLTSLDVLKNTIDSSQSDLDNDWIRQLPQKQLNAEVTQQHTVHSEAMLMALTHNPSLQSIRNAGAEEVCPVVYTRKSTYWSFVSNRYLRICTLQLRCQISVVTAATSLE